MAQTGTNEGASPAAAKKKAPTLYFIIIAKLIKGFLALLVAVGVYSLRDKNLPEVFRHVLEFLHQNPEKQFYHDLAKSIEEVTPGNLRGVAMGTLIYSLFALVEGFGLIFRLTWVGWLTIGESAFFIPIEVYELIHRRQSALQLAQPPHRPYVLLTILAFNILIVWYLFQNRKRLFRHH